MKGHPLATGIMSVPLSVAVLLASLDASGQAPGSPDTGEEDEAARAQRIARRFERDAMVLTVFDRQGNVVATIGERDLYRGPVFSPDGTRLAVDKRDLENNTRDLWVIDIATGETTRITANASRSEEWAVRPVWSPDGSQLAYVALRDGYEGIYRKASNGEGEEELLYRELGAGILPGDWSLDGRYLSFSVSDLFFEGTLYALPMDGDGERAPIEVFRSESQLQAGSFSEDGRFLSYTSDATGRDEVYVRSFDPFANSQAVSANEAVQISDTGGEFAILSGWRQDGDEFYYVAADRGIMAAQVDTETAFTLENSTLLFRPSLAIFLDEERINVSRDGERIVLAVPHAPTLGQITVFDRQGTVVHELGEPGVYRNPSFSPDGMTVATQKLIPETNRSDIWTYDLTSGEGVPVTDDSWFDGSPVWSPDGSRLAYGSERDNIYASIYVKASDGTGDAEQVYQYTPGAGLQLTDWSADGRFLTFNDGCWGVLYIVPLAGEEDAGGRQAIEWLRDEYLVAQARFAPDGRFISYISDEQMAEQFQIYVAPFDASQANGGWGTAPPVQVTVDDVVGAVSWRGDGEELYYVTADWDVMAVNVTTTSAFEAETPRLLFTLPGPLAGSWRQWKIASLDGERFVFVLNVSATVP